MESYVGRGAGAHIEKQLFSSKNFALICSPWISAEFTKRIIQMVERGVSCRVITSDREAGDTEKTLELLKEFVKPETDYLGRPQKDWSPPPFDYKIISDWFVHTKIYISDGKYAVTGSANLTNNGLWQNAEHVIILNNANDIEKIESDFEHLWNFYEAKEIVDESSNVLKDLWKKIKGFRKAKEESGGRDGSSQKVKSKRFWRKK